MYSSFDDTPKVSRTKAMDKLWLIYWLVCIARFNSNITFTGKTINGGGKTVGFISVQYGAIRDMRIENDIILIGLKS